jgi:hypothetical protein
LGDAAHKLLSPGTYACDLCAITYGAWSMRPEWRDYVERLAYPAHFYHRGEFHRAYPQVEITLPAILIEDGGDFPRLLVQASDMNRGQSVADLIALLDGALQRQSGQRV